MDARRRTPHLPPSALRRSETDERPRPPRFDSGQRVNHNNRPPYPPRQSAAPPPSTPRAFLPRQPEIKITNDMQITDGKYRGLQLKSTLSPKVRPTARRVREALFKILGKRIRFARFLDLCAGCGIVGIEAISRGALLGTFVERSGKMCHFIEENLKTCEISLGHGEIVNLECVPFLKRMAQRRRVWDVVYFDPPYEADYEEVLQFFARGACLRQDGGILVIEHHAEMFFPQTVGCLERRRVIREGDTALTFYERLQ
jgi:16S rRNA (guanine966-N2)-methyltransferase